MSGDRVLEAIREEFMYTFGQRVEASFMDVLIVNFMYGCLDPNSPNVPGWFDEILLLYKSVSNVDFRAMTKQTL